MRIVVCEFHFYLLICFQFYLLIWQINLEMTELESYFFFHFKSQSFAHEKLCLPYLFVMNVIENLTFLTAIKRAFFKIAVDLLSSESRHFFLCFFFSLRFELIPFYISTSIKGNHKKNNFHFFFKPNT